jgi:hypothetical protein
LRSSECEESSFGVARRWNSTVKAADVTMLEV